MSYQTGQPTDERTLPAVVYGLYLLGLVTGLTVLIGLIVAYVNKGQAGETARTHYIFQIRTFWVGIAWCLIGVLLFALGVPLSFILVGLPLVFLGWAIFALGGVWFVIRMVLGLMYLARGEPYPRPRTWLF